MKRALALALIISSVTFPWVASAAVATSTNYQLQDDSINIGGTDHSTSSSYSISDTVGQNASGRTDSNSYLHNAGYRQGSSTSQVEESPACDNDGVCEAGEDHNNCPNDCPGGGGPGPTIYACSDGVDNDTDGFTDLNDPGCDSATDTSEYNPLFVPPVLNFQATYNPLTGEIDLTWDNPIFDRLEAVRVVKLVSPNIPTGPLDGVMVYDGPGESAADGNVTDGETYFYAAFVRDTETPANYSIGVIASAAVPDPGDENVPSEPIDPFDVFPKAKSTHPGLSSGDFRFIQVGEITKFFTDGGRVRVNGGKDLTILLPYDRAPEVLKIIGMTIFAPGGSSANFSFLLKINENKTAYSAMIGHLPDGDYPFKIHFIDYSDQSIKILSGLLVVREGNLLLSPLGTIGEVGEQAALIAGLIAGILHAFLATGKVGSLADIYLMFVRGLGSLLGLLGLRKKRVPWGTVYDAITKRPLDPAYVSLLLGDKEVSSAITDIDGRYGFFAPAGLYTLKAGKTHYEFPSKTLAGQLSDELYSNLYFGEPLMVGEGEVLARNVPMDPIGFDWNEFVKSKRDFFQVHSRRSVVRERVFNTIFAVGCVFSIGEMIYAPSLLNLGIFILYGALLVLQVFWVARHKVVSLRRASGDPLSFAIVKVYLPGTEQLIRKVVADDLGRFYVLVPPGDYYITVEEKKDDKTYNLIFKSETLTLKKGVFAKDISIP